MGTFFSRALSQCKTQLILFSFFLALVSIANASTVISTDINTGGTITGLTLSLTGSTATSTFLGGLNIGGGLILPTLNCTGLGNSGKLTTDALGNLTCSDDISGSALSGGSIGGLTYWTSATTISATSSPTMGWITATSTTATSTFAGPVLINSTLTNATSTITIGDVQSSLAGCINMVTHSGGVFATSSFYMIGATIVGEANACK